MTYEIPKKDAHYGWSTDGPNHDYITWETPRADVQKVEIQFRDDRNDMHAQIADLQIYYCDLDYIV